MPVVNLTGDAAVAVTKSDTADDPNGPFIAAIVWNAGTVALLDANGNASGTSDSLPAGTVLSFKIKRVKSTGTTATLLGYKGVL